MKCPKCDVDLSISDRQGIEIDFCPKCRGVWLDRGELDKIIERASKFNDDRDDDDRRRLERGRLSDRDRQFDPDYDRDRDRYPRRKSFWTELFD